MKKLLIFCFITLVLSSCSVDDAPVENNQFEFVPIESVSVPEMLVGGNVERITYSYLQQTSCHSFSSLYFQSNVNVVTVAVVNLLDSSTNCEPLVNVLDERGFDFDVAPGFSNYVFRFWQGEDENGEDIYLTVDVPVLQ